MRILVLNNLIETDWICHIKIKEIDQSESMEHSNFFYNYFFYLHIYYIGIRTPVKIEVCHTGYFEDEAIPLEGSEYAQQYQNCLDKCHRVIEFIDRHSSKKEHPFPKFEF